MDAEEVGRIVRAIREAQGLSRIDLVNRSGVKHGTLVSIEQGRYQPRLKNLVPLADALRTSVDALLGREPVTLGSDKLPSLARAS